MSRSRSTPALLAVLAIAALCLITISCSTTNLASIRIINAMSDSQPTDIYINNAKVASSLAFGSIFPTPGTVANYETIQSGSETIDGYPPGDTTNPISPIGTFSLNGSTDYTIIAAGLAESESLPLIIEDDNITPSAGTLEYRIINASFNSPQGGVDVYFVPPGTDLTNYAPQITKLAYGQASPYEPLKFLSSGYSVIVTKNGFKNPLITETATPPVGSITTIVLIDNVGGNNGLSQTPLILNDLN